MREENVVSLWVGLANSAGALDEYLRVSYSDDGDWIQSSFARDFGIDYYDEDFREAIYLEESAASIRTLLQGCSYDDVVIPKFLQFYGESLPQGLNAAVLLYNFMYKGKIRVINASEVRLLFIGAAKLGD